MINLLMQLIIYEQDLLKKNKFCLNTFLIVSSNNIDFILSTVSSAYVTTDHIDTDHFNTMMYK